MSRWKRLGRKAGRWALWGTLAIVVTMLLLIGWIHSRWGESFLKGKIVEGATEAIPGSLLIGSFEGSVFGTPTLRALRLHDPEDQLVAEIASLTVDLSLWEMAFGEQVRVDGLDIEGIGVFLKRDESGRFNLLRSLIPEEPQDSDPARLDFRDIRVTDSFFVYEDARVELSMLHIESLTSQGGRTLIDIGELSGALSNCGGREFSAAGGILVTDTGVEIEGLRLTSGDSELVLNATLASDLRSIEVELSGTIDRALLECLAPSTPWRRNVAFTGSALRAIEDAEVTIALSIDDGAISLQGAVSPELEKIDATLRLHEFRPADLVSMDFNGIVNGHLEIEAAESLDATAVGSMSILIDGRTLEVEEIQMTNHEKLASVTAKLKAFGASANAGAKLRWGEQLMIDEGRLTAEVRSLSELPGLAQLRGSIKTLGALEFEGPMDSIRITGAVQGKDLKFEETRLARATIDLDLSDLPSSMAGTVDARAQGLVQGRERIGPLEAHIESNWNATDFTFSVKAGRRKRLWASISGTAKRLSSGDLITLQTMRLQRGKVSARLRNKPTTPATVLLDDDDDIVLRDMRFALAGGRVDIHGTLHRSIEIKIGKVELASLFKLVPHFQSAISGRLGGTVTISNAKQGTTVDTTLTVEKLQLDPSGEPLKAQIAGRLTPTNIEASIGITGVKSGTASLQTEFRRQPSNSGSLLSTRLLRSSRLALEDFDLQSLRSLHPKAQSARGHLSGEIEVLAGVASVKGKLTGTGMTHEFWPSKLSGHIEIDATDTSLRLDTDLQDSELGGVALLLRLVPPRPLRDIRNWPVVSPGALRDTDLSFRDVNLRALQKRLPWLDTDVAGTLSGRVGARDNGSTLSIRSSIKDLQFKQRPKASAQMNATIKDASTQLNWVIALNSKTHLEGEASTDVGLSILSGPLHSEHLRTIAEGLHFAVTTTLVSNSPAFLSQVAGVESDVVVTGKVTATVSAEGSLRDPKAELEVGLSDATVDGVSLQKVTLSGKHRGSVAAVSVRVQQSENRFLSAAVDVDTTTQTLRSASVLAKNIDLRLFRALDTRGRGLLSSLEGVANGKLDIAGSWDHPEPEGWFKVRKAGIELGNSLMPITNASLDAKVKDKRITISMKGRSGRGSIGVRGGASVDGRKIVDMAAQVQAAELPVTVGDFVYSADVSANTALERLPGLWDIRTTIDKAVIRIPVEVFGGEGRHLHSVDGMSDLVYLSEKKASRQKKELSEEAPLVRIRVRADESIEVRSRELSARVDLDLLTTFVGSTPLIAGSARVVRGHLDLFERRYVIERATASFHQRSPINPSLDLKLRHDFDELSLVILATGELDDPKVSFNADPAGFDQSTLLAIFLGQSPAQHENEQGLRDNALAALSTLAANKLQDALAPLLPIDIDVVRIEKTDNDGELYTVGEWINDRWFVAWRHRSIAEDLENSNEFESRYKLSKRWSLEGNYGDRNAGGVDVLWTKRWGK